MKKSLLLFILIAILSKGGLLKSQTLYVPGGFTSSGVGTSTVSGKVGIGTSTPAVTFDVVGGDSRFDENYKLIIPSSGSSYFWKGTDGYDNVKWSVWDKLTLYNPTTAGLNTSNSGWNIQFGARDGSINTKGSASFASSAGNVFIGGTSIIEPIVTGRKYLSVQGVSEQAVVELVGASSDADDKPLGFITGVDGTSTFTDKRRAIISFKTEGSTANKRGGKIIFSTAQDNVDGTITEKMRLTKDGNLLINKTSQTNSNYKLDVAGSIRANEVVVNTTGADFVFEPGYQLMSLKELETYLKSNRHLPGIAPAAEMQENGVSSGEMQTKLLQKVEELTLYVIELKKENEAMKAEHQKTSEQLLKEIENLKLKLNNNEL